MGNDGTNNNDYIMLQYGVSNGKYTQYNLSNDPWSAHHVHMNIYK